MEEGRCRRQHSVLSPTPERRRSRWAPSPARMVRAHLDHGSQEPEDPRERGNWNGLSQPSFHFRSRTDTHLAQFLRRRTMERAVSAEQGPDSKWCRERGSNPHGLSPKGFWVLGRPGTNGNHRPHLEPVQQLGCIDVEARLAHSAISKLIVLAQNW